MAANWYKVYLFENTNVKYIKLCYKKQKQQNSFELISENLTSILTLKGAFSTIETTSVQKVNFKVQTKYKIVFETLKLKPLSFITSSVSAIFDLFGWYFWYCLIPKTYLLKFSWSVLLSTINRRNNEISKQNVKNIKCSKL